MESAQVAVIGGGPAGVSFALHAAGAGLDVLLLDRRQGERDKVCGEGLMPHGVAELRRLGLEDRLDDALAPSFRGIHYASGSMVARGDFPLGSGRGVRRKRLDRLLLEAAEGHPRIQVRQGVRVRRIEPTPVGWRFETEAGEFGAGLLVGADGLMSPTRRWLGLSRPSRGRRRYGLRAHYRLAEGVPLPGRVEVTLCAWGEVYLTPTGPGEVNLALLIERGEDPLEPSQLLESALRDVPELRERLRGAQLLEPPSAIGPLRQESVRPFADRAVLVGDAAGFLDGLTGEGISLALGSGRLAAEVVAEAWGRRPLSAPALAAYADRAREAYADQLRLTEGLLWGIRHRRLAKAVIRLLARQPGWFGRVLAINEGRSLLHSLWSTAHD